MCRCKSPVHQNHLKKKSWRGDLARRPPLLGRSGVPMSLWLAATIPIRNRLSNRSLKHQPPIEIEGFLRQIRASAVFTTSPTSKRLFDSSSKHDEPTYQEILYEELIYQEHRHASLPSAMNRHAKTTRRQQRFSGHLLTRSPDRQEESDIASETVISPAPAMFELGIEWREVIAPYQGAR
jgi:hypothetical protein